MKKIDLNSPILRKTELKYEEFEYKILNNLYLNKPEIKENPLILNVINNRVTKRIFKPLSDEKLNAILWHSARTIRVSNNPEMRWEHRPSPSAGGRHPIDLFIIEPQKTEHLLLYRNSLHALAQVSADSYQLSKMLRKVKKILDIQNGTLIWCGAQFDRTLSRYKNGESLIWRDAGALVTVITLVAESLGVNVCPLGITGEPYFSKSLGTKQVVGIGGFCIGEN